MTETTSPEQAPEVCATARSVTAGAGKPALAERPLISPGQAGEVVGLFKVLANDSRLRLLHALERAGELCVSDLADQVGMRPQAADTPIRDQVRTHYAAAATAVTAGIETACCPSAETGTSCCATHLDEQPGLGAALYTVTVDALRALCLGGPTATPVWQALGLIGGLLAVTVPAAVLQYQRTTAS